jgi:hypothetical protein
MYFSSFLELNLMELEWNKPLLVLAWFVSGAIDPSSATVPSLSCH